MESAKTKKTDIIKKDFYKNWQLYVIVLPVLAFYIMFCYVPMYGALIAFKDYFPSKGFMRSEWVGFKHFYDFFTTPDFFRLIKNTITISVTNLIVGFPAPIIFALCLNEIRQLRFKKIVQTLTYLPHFISLVVICGMITGFVNSGGIISKALSPIIGENINMLTLSNMFVPIYVFSDIWQGIGWSSIIYIAALSGIDAQLYEAAKIDGAGKWRQLFNVTLPCLSPTIVILLILRIGGLLNVGFEKIVLLYNPLIYESSDVISTYVYRLGFENQQWSYTTAVGLLNSLINFGLLISANYISRKVNGASLW